MARVWNKFGVLLVVGYLSSRINFGHIFYINAGQTEDATGVSRAQMSQTLGNFHLERGLVGGKSKTPFTSDQKPHRDSSVSSQAPPVITLSKRIHQ